MYYLRATLGGTVVKAGMQITPWSRGLSPAARRAAGGLRLGAVLSLMVPAGVTAQQDSTRADTTAARLEEIVVRAVRPITSVGGSSAIRARADSMKLPATATLEQVFRALPMLHVRRNSRGEAELSARGSDSRQVAVLVDGVPLHLAWDARTDVSVIPATAPQGISFSPGLSSMLHGPNVLGGVVEIEVGRSLLQPSSPAADLTVGVDHVGGFGGKASITLPSESENGRWLVRGGLGYADSPGLPLASGISEPVATGNDLRLNTDSRSVDGFATVRYHSNTGAWFSFSGSSFTAERGIAAELGVENARFWRYPNVSRTVAVLSGGTGDRPSPLGGYGDLEASVGLDLGRTDIDAYATRAYEQTSGFEDGEDRTLTLRLLGDQTLGTRGELRAAFTLSDIRHDEVLPEGEARYRQRLWSVGGETVWRLIEEGRGVNSLRLSIGGAYDRGATPESGGREALGTLSQWGGRLGLTMAVRDGATLLHGGLSRRGRFPALRELYSGALDRFAPSPDLQPEHLVVMETGISNRIGRRSEVQATLFRHQMNDAVVRITLPDRRFMRVNRNRLTSHGVELFAGTVLGSVGLGGDLTIQSVTLTDTEADVTNRPENLPEVFGSLFVQAPLALGVTGNVEARYTGSQFCIDPGTGEDTRLDAGTILSGGVARTWWVRREGAGLLSRLEGRLSLDNIGNTALYDQCGLPQPGRLVRFQVRLF